MDSGPLKVMDTDSFVRSRVFLMTPRKGAVRSTEGWSMKILISSASHRGEYVYLDMLTLWIQKIQNVGLSRFILSRSSFDIIHHSGVRRTLRGPGFPHVSTMHVGYTFHNRPQVAHCYPNQPRNDLGFLPLNGQDLTEQVPKGG